MKDNDPTITVIKEAAREAWGLGYQACINALRDMVDETDNEELVLAIKTLADELQALKP